MGQSTGTATDAEAAITYSMKPDHIEKMYGFMDEAIKILRKGDNDCKLRAAQLSRQLMVWMRTYSLGEVEDNRRGRLKGDKYMKERDRAKEILAWIFPTEEPETKQDERKRFRKDILKDANMEEAKTIPVAVKPRCERKPIPEKPPTPLPSELRTCRNCGMLFESRNKLFEKHVNRTGACFSDLPVARDDLVIHHNGDPFMGYSSPREWE